MKKKFRIVEITNVDGTKVFLVEIGTFVQYNFFFKTGAWEPVKDGDKPEVFLSFENAYNKIVELKKQLPIYHNVK